MLRFGRMKKKTKAEERKSEDDHLPQADHTAAPSLLSSSPDLTAFTPARVPSVSLPHVETQLSMHQHNELFENGLAEENPKGQQQQHPPAEGRDQAQEPIHDLDQEPQHHEQHLNGSSTAVGTDCSTLNTGEYLQEGCGPSSRRETNHGGGGEGFEADGDDTTADQASSLSLSPNPTNGDTSSTGEWSSAVGHATTGKSGRVIHTLQEDIARLTREVGVYRSRAEETQRMNDVYKTQVQNMGERLRNLELANETNLQSIARKDQKLKELREEVQAEKERRQNAEGTANHTNQLMTQARDEYNRKTAELQDIANMSHTQYDVLLKSRQRENAEQQKRFKVIRDDFLELKSQHETKHVELERLDTIMAQKNREIEAGRDSFDKLYETYEAYKKAHDEDVQGLINKGRHGSEQLDAALASLKATEGQMKWVMVNHERLKESGQL